MTKHCPGDLIAVLEPNTPKSLTLPWPGGENYEIRGWRLIPAGCLQDKSLCTSLVVEMGGKWILARDKKPGGNESG